MTSGSWLQGASQALALLARPSATSLTTYPPQTKFQRIHRRSGRRAAASSEPPGIDGRKRQRRKEGRLREGKEGEEGGEGWGMSCTGQAARPRAGGH